MDEGYSSFDKKGKTPPGSPLALKRVGETSGGVDGDDKAAADATSSTEEEAPATPARSEQGEGEVNEIKLYVYNEKSEGKKNGILGSRSIGTSS